MIKTYRQPIVPWAMWTIHSHDPVQEFEPEKLTLIEASVYVATKNRTPLDSAVLDYFLENQDDIPKSWQGKVVYFFGTIFDSKGVKYVRSMNYQNERWYAGLGDEITAPFPNDCFAVVV